MEREKINLLIEQKKYLTISLINGRGYSGNFFSISPKNKHGEETIEFKDSKGYIIYFRLKDLVSIEQLHRESIWDEVDHVQH
jgi:hypothetical protein